MFGFTSSPFSVPHLVYMHMDQTICEFSYSFTSPYSRSRTTWSDGGQINNVQKPIVPLRPREEKRRAGVWTKAMSKQASKQRESRPNMQYPSPLTTTCLHSRAPTRNKNRAHCAYQKIWTRKVLLKLEKKAKLHVPSRRIWNLSHLDIREGFRGT